MDSKICGVSDANTLNYLINHPYPPQFIGFICNYKKSPRYVNFDNLKNLINIKKRNIKFVSVLVKPDPQILEKMGTLDFDYYQIYDCNPADTLEIKKKFNKKIITALTIQNSDDVKKYKLYEDVADIYLFDSKGYEKSMSFNHNLIKDIKIKKELMIAGNIKFNDHLENYSKIADIIDISGGVETSGFKDLSKIEIFLKNVYQVNNEN